MLYSMQKYMAIGAIEYAKRLKAPVINLDRSQNFNLIVHEPSYQLFSKKYLLNDDEKERSNGLLIMSFINGLGE